MAIVVLSITQLVFYLITAGGAAFISKDAHDVLQGVLNEFGKDPENPRFHHVLQAIQIARFCQKYLSGAQLHTLNFNCYVLSIKRSCNTNNGCLIWRRAIGTHGLHMI